MGLKRKKEGISRKAKACDHVRNTNSLTIPAYFCTGAFFPFKICFLWSQGYYNRRSGVGCILRVSSTVQDGIGMCTHGFPNRDGCHRDTHPYFLGHVSFFLSQTQNIFFLILHYFSIIETLDVSD